MNVRVVVPRRDGQRHRDALWSWNKERWAREHPDWPVVEGHHTDGPFNRSAAINRGAEGDWDVMIVADSDSFVAPSQARTAAAIASDTGQVTFAFDRFCYLDRNMTDLILKGYTGDWWPGVQFTMPGTCSSMVAVPRGPWDECGGADEGFVGWGGEDIALSLMLQTFGGGMHRVHGDVWHLWHPEAPKVSRDWPDRVDRYGDAAYDRAAMRALIEELRCSPV